MGTAVRNIAVWLPLFLVEPALRILNGKECVAEKGHEACGRPAALLPVALRARRRRSQPA